MSPGASPRIYKEEYVAGLKDALQILGTEDTESLNGTRLDALSRLLHRMLHAEGRMDAFDFAWSIKGDLPLLQARLEDTDVLISSPPENVKGVLLSDVGLRAYVEGHLEGLRDIIETISTSNPWVRL
jgi:hypothetical protein